MADMTYYMSYKVGRGQLKVKVKNCLSSPFVSVLLQLGYFLVVISYLYVQFYVHSIGRLL